MVHFDQLITKLVFSNQFTHKWFIFNRFFIKILCSIGPLISGLFWSFDFITLYFMIDSPMSNSFKPILFKILFSNWFTINGLFWPICLKAFFSHQFTHERFVFNQSFQNLCFLISSPMSASLYRSFFLNLVLIHP